MDQLQISIHELDLQLFQDPEASAELREWTSREPSAKSWNYFCTLVSLDSSRFLQIWRVIYVC